MRVFQIVLWLFCTACQLTAAPTPAATVHIPMRDGLELTADLFYPAGSVITNEYPCILIRLPGGRKAESWLHLAELAQHGYVVAIQDTRSALDPEGKTMPYVSDGWGVHQDGLDTVNWLASSSFTNGVIGTLGFSAGGVTQLMMAPTAPPALKCQYIGQAAGSPYHHAIFAGGQFQKNQVETWLSYYAPHSSVIESVKQQPFYNQFWQFVDSVSMSHQVEVPAVHYGGWYDPFLQGTIDAFVARQQYGKEGAKGCQKLLIGPWTHAWPLDMTLGEYPIPENGRHAPLDISARRWFDHYLKGIENHIAEVPEVTYYVMGPVDGSPSSGNIWRHSDVWPVPAVEVPFYLTADKALADKIQSKDDVVQFVCDPSNPVPSIGGRNLFLPSGPRDMRSIEARSDVLVFTTKPFEEDTEVTGNLLVKLFFTSNVPDADISVRMSDVYPDGKSLLVAEGIVRTGVIPARAVAKNTPKEVAIDLWSTSLVIAKGHAIRISISGSDYPHFEKNLHGALPGDPPVIAKNTIHLGPDYPSRLILPVVRKGNTWLTAPQPEDQAGASETEL